MTDLIDRLERKGYARRAPHPDDGRRVLVSGPGCARLGRHGALFVDWVHSLEELYATFTDEQLQTISDFMTQAAGRQRAATEQLTQH